MQRELESLGLSENETKVYLALLRQGQQSPYELSDRTGLNRSYLYDLLNQMVEKGYANRIQVKRRAAFQASPPEQIYEILQLRAEEAKRLVPKLQKVSRPAETTTVELHKGKEMYRTLIKDALAGRLTQDVLVISADEEAFEELDPVLLKQYFRRLREKGIKERVLIKKGGARFGSAYEQAPFTYKEIPGALIGNASTIVYGDSVAEIVFGTPNTMTITRNKEMARAKRKLFEYLWRHADEIPG